MSNLVSTTSPQKKMDTCPTLPSHIGLTSSNTLRNSIFLWILLFSLFLAFAPNYHWLPDKGTTPYGADFLHEWVGARIVLEGESQNLYDLELFQARQNDSQTLGFQWDKNSFFPPVYPPIHYIAFTPFALIPYRWAVLLWPGILLALTIIAVHQLQNIARRYISTTYAASNHHRALHNAILFGVLLFPPILASLTLGQKSVLWLVLFTTTWQLLLNNRPLSAGFVFGLLSIKPTLFFLLPLVLLSRGQFKFFLGASITVAMLWGGGLLLLPTETWLGFLEVARGSSTYANVAGYRLDWSCNLLALAYASPTSYQAWFKQSFCVILAIYCLICCFEKRNADILSPEKLLLVLCVTFLLSPHAYSYDLCLFLLPIVSIFAQQPRLGFIYFTLLTITIATATAFLNLFSLPVLPILLLAIVSELRLRTLYSQGNVDEQRSLPAANLAS